jgi:hypothetical protein
MPKKTAEQDGGEWLRKWHNTRITNLQRISGATPENLCIDELNLTICCRYVETLLRNPSVKKYLSRYHPKQLLQIEDVIVALKSRSNLKA